MGFLKPHTDKIYALLRIVAGLMFMQHGLQKLFALFGGMPAGAPAFITYGAGSIELLGGALIAIGLFCSPVAFIASGEMAFAFFLGHCDADQEHHSDRQPGRARRALLLAFPLHRR